MQCEWVLINADGTAIQGAPGESPRHFLGGDDQILVLPYVALAPSEDASIEFLATTDVSLNTGASKRLLGPGIQSPHTVRLWKTRNGHLVLTDGPIENAYKAEERIAVWQS